MSNFGIVYFGILGNMSAKLQYFPTRRYNMLQCYDASVSRYYNEGLQRHCSTATRKLRGFSNSDTKYTKIFFKRKVLSSRWLFWIISRKSYFVTFYEMMLITFPANIMRETNCNDAVTDLYSYSVDGKISFFIRQWLIAAKFTNEFIQEMQR